MKAGKPIGGKWTFDTENRKKYPKNRKAPSIHFPESNQYYEEAKKYTEENFIKKLWKSNILSTLSSHF